MPPRHEPSGCVLFFTFWDLALSSLGLTLVGADGGPVTPAATSGDLRGAVQRRTDVQRARAIQTLGLEDWKGLMPGTHCNALLAT